MCGRFVLVAEANGFIVRWLPRISDSELQELLGRGEIAHILNNYQVRPTNNVPVVTSEDGHRRIEVARWGLVPSWWRDSDKFPPTAFNARSENLSSGMWRGPVSRSRCLVPATGFYEWPVKGKGKPPVYIHRKDGQLIAFAGLSDVWQNPTTGEAVRSCAIVTSAPNEFMAPVHDRMPVLLTDTEAEALWLDPASKKLDDVAHLLRPLEWEGMTRHWVRPLSSSLDGPELTDPAPEQPVLA